MDKFLYGTLLGLILGYWTGLLVYAPSDYYTESLKVNDDRAMREFQRNCLAAKGSFSARNIVPLTVPNEIYWELSCTYIPTQIRGER